MTSKHGSLPSPSASPASGPPIPWAATTRAAVLVTLVIGAYVHVTRLLIGSELLISQIYTARFDALFAIPMLLGAVGIVPAWRQFAFRGRAERAVVGIAGPISSSAFRCTCKLCCPEARAT